MCHTLTTKCCCICDLLLKHELTVFPETHLYCYPICAQLVSEVGFRQGPLLQHIVHHAQQSACITDILLPAIGVNAHTARLGCTVNCMLHDLPPDWVLSMQAEDRRIPNHLHIPGLGLWPACLQGLLQDSNQRGQLASVSSHVEGSDTACAAPWPDTSALECGNV